GRRPLPDRRRDARPRAGRDVADPRERPARGRGRARRRGRGRALHPVAVGLDRARAAAGGPATVAPAVSRRTGRGPLFDFDGLIVDTETAALTSWRRLYEEHGQELLLEHWSAAVGTVGGFDAVAHLEGLVGPLDRETIARRREHELRLTEVEQLRP